MIKANVNVAGTITRAATMKGDKDNSTYVSLALSVSIPDSEDMQKTIEINVIYPQGKQSDLDILTEKRRIAAIGVMDVRKKGEDFIFYLNAEQITVKDVSESDLVTGDLQFRGRLKNDKVYEERTDKKGNPYLVFSAYSSEKIGDNFVSTWVNFIRFPEKGSDIDSIKPSWLRSKATIQVEGEFKIAAVKGNIRLNCRVSSMKPYDSSKPEQSTQ